MSRPRVVNGHVYYPVRNLIWREEIQWAARRNYHGKPLECALSLEIKIYRRYEVTSRRAGDVDNLAKAIMDGLNGIIYADDAQIVKLLIEKHKDKRARAEVRIKSLGTSRAEANACASRAKTS